MSTEVITLARSASGVRIVITPISGALTSGPKKDDSASADHHRRDGKVEREREHGQRQRDERCRAEAERVVAADDLHCRDAAEHGAEAEGREERPRHLRTVELLVGEHGEPRAQHLSEPVRDERREPENAQEPVAQEEADSREDALAVVRLRQRWPARGRRARAGRTSRGRSRRRRRARPARRRRRSGAPPLPARAAPWRDSRPRPRRSPARRRARRRPPARAG